MLICICTDREIILEVTILAYFLYANAADGSVGIAMGYGLEGPGSIPESARFFSSPKRPYRILGPPSLVFNGYRGRFPRGSRSRSVKLFTHLHLMPRSRIVELRRGADKSSAFPICSKTKIIFLGWVKEVRTTKS
jgi:hypothetical protein